MKEGSGKLSITFQKVNNISDALKVLRDFKIEELV